MANFPQWWVYTGDARSDHLSIVKILDQIERSSAKIAHLLNKRATVKIDERTARCVSWEGLERGHDRSKVERSERSH
jgi:hypothetical protein